MRTNRPLAGFIAAGMLALSVACLSVPGPTPESSPPTPTPTVQPQTGTIAGNLSYPSEMIPPLRVVAFDANSMAAAGSVDTQLGDSSYSLTLPAGTYYVVAYTQDGMLSAGYSQAVPCGLTFSCSDHTLIAVQVLANISVPDIDPGDWYAPPGAFPPMP